MVGSASSCAELVPSPRMSTRGDSLAAAALAGSQVDGVLSLDSSPNSHHIAKVLLPAPATHRARSRPPVPGPLERRSQYNFDRLDVSTDALQERTYTVAQSPSGHKNSRGAPARLARREPSREGLARPSEASGVGGGRGGPKSGANPLRVPMSRRVGSRRALLAANHRGRVWEPSQGSHVSEMAHNLLMLPL